VTGIHLHHWHGSAADDDDEEEEAEDDDDDDDDDDEDDNAPTCQIPLLSQSEFQSKTKAGTLAQFTPCNINIAIEFSEINNYEFYAVHE